MSVMLELLPSAGPALVVGGGTVALRRTRNLASGGFAVTVIAPAIDPAIRDLPGVTCLERGFVPGDISEADPRWAVVVACTDRREVNRAAGDAARASGIPVVVADAQAESTAFTPATLRDGGLQVAVSTGGADPALAMQLRERIAAALGPGWADTVAAARKARESRLGREGGGGDA